MNNKEKNYRIVSSEEVAKTVVAIEEGKKRGLTPFQSGVAMGIREIVVGNNKNRNNKK